MEQFGLTQEAVSQSVGKSRPAVANALRLLSLGEEVSDMLEQGLLTTGHARALLALESKALQLQAAKQAAEKGLSVRQTEALVASLLKEPKKKPKAAADAVDYAAEMSQQLGTALGRKVTIVDGRKRGRVVLEYYSADDREALLQALMKLKN